MIRTSVLLATLHTVMMGLMLVLSSSSSAVITQMTGMNATEGILEAITDEVDGQNPPGDGWRICFFIAVFLLSKLVSYFSQILLRFECWRASMGCVQ